MFTQVLKKADLCECVGVCSKLHEHFSHSLLPTLAGFTHSKQEAIKMTR